MTDTSAMALDTARPAPVRERLVDAVVAEATGTAMLVAAIVGSGIAADQAFPDGPGMVLLVNAIVTGTILAAPITALGPVSSAFNPVVALLHLANRRTAARIGTDTCTGISPTSAAVFITAQAHALPIVYLLARLITRRTP